MGVPVCGIISAFPVGGIEPPRVCRLGQPPLLMNCLPSAPCCKSLLMFAESCLLCFIPGFCNREHKTETVRILKAR